MNILSYAAEAFRHYRKLGAPGIRAYVKRFSKSEEIVQVDLAHLPHPLYLRTRSSDIGVFDQIFYLDYYKFNYGSNPKVIVDCGANIGMTTVYFKNAFPEARIIAVEPDPANFEMLRKNTEHYENITCLQMGVWHNTAHLEINNREHQNSSGFMVEEVPVPSSTSIPAISLSGLMDRYQLETIDILKMDIEGSEREVFGKNYERWLPHVKLLIIETHDFMKPGCAKSLFNALNDYEYQLEFSGESFFIRMGV